MKPICYVKIVLLLLIMSSCEKKTYEFSDLESTLINYNENEVFSMLKLPELDTINFEVLSKRTYTKEESYYYSPDSYSSHCDIELGSESITIEMKYVKAMEGFSLNIIVNESDKEEVWYSYELNGEIECDS